MYFFESRAARTVIVENPWPSQTEYSLIERTAEGELIPMALELGLGVTPGRR